jgi:CheY-like chemotaxis protein
LKIRSVGPDSGGKKVLIAEDHPVGRELLREMVQSLGYQVIETGDGEEALRKIRETTPHLAIIDVQMPKVDGFAVIQELRGWPEYADFPVIALTGFAKGAGRERILDAGFSAYLAKPIRLKELNAELKRFLG